MIMGNKPRFGRAAHAGRVVTGFNCGRIFRACSRRGNGGSFPSPSWPCRAAAILRRRGWRLEIEHHVGRKRVKHLMQPELAVAGKEPAHPRLDAKLVGRGDGAGGIAKLHIVDQLRIDGFEVGGRAAGAGKMQGIEHDAGILAAGRRDEFRRLPDRAHGAVGEEFDPDIEAALGAQFAGPREIGMRAAVIRVVDDHLEKFRAELRADVEPGGKLLGLRLRHDPIAHPIMHRDAGVLQRLLDRPGRERRGAALR